MRVYVIRHAAAASREEYDSDFDRPLTKKGIATMKLVAARLASAGIRPERIFTSPLIRAVETAEIVAEALEEKVPVEECDELATGSAADVVSLLADTGLDEVAVVGHEPQLGEVVALMVAGNTDEIVDMKKASVACVDFDGSAAAGQGVLAWHVIPKILK